MRVKHGWHEKSAKTVDRGLPTTDRPLTQSIPNRNHCTPWPRCPTCGTATSTTKATQDSTGTENQTNKPYNVNQGTKGTGILAGCAAADQDNQGQRIEPIYKVVFTGHFWKGPILLSVSQSEGENVDKRRQAEKREGNQTPKTYLFRPFPFTFLLSSFAHAKLTTFPAMFQLLFSSGFSLVLRFLSFHSSTKSVHSSVSLRVSSGFLVGVESSP